MTAVPIVYRDLSMPQAGAIYLIDAAGLEDSDGPEIDIANVIGIVEGLKECSKVRPVILISYYSMGVKG